MDIYEFDWDPAIVEKVILKHKVSPSEVEQVFQGQPKVTSHRGVFIALGQSLAGRYLCVVFRKMDTQTIRIITARKMTKNERKLFGK